MEEKVDEIFEKIRRATRTLRKLPRVAVKSRFCAWPEVIRSFHEAYGYNDPDPPRIVPTAKQLSELDRVIAWMSWLTQHEGFGSEYTRIVWARAENHPWRHIAAVSGLGKDTCRERFILGVYAIAYAIDQGRIK